MSVSGGKRIRTLRKARKETLLNIATDAGITYRTLSEVETGATAQPDKETLERILNALDELLKLSLEEWQQVYEAYGYYAPIFLPTQAEIKWACGYWKEFYKNLQYPAYLIHIGQELLDWNRYAPHLIGLNYDDPRTAMFKNTTTLDLVFTLAHGIIKIEDQREYLNHLIHIIKRELFPYRNERWHEDFVKKNREKYAEFGYIWDELPEEISMPKQGNIIKLTSPQNGTLHFQLVALRIDDPRFTVVEWLPLGDQTIRKCNEWIEEEQKTISN